MLVYTSGTTGPPKGAMHDHASLMWGFANSYLEAFPELNEGVHRAVSHLPVAHLIERSMSMYLPLVADVVPHIGEEVEDLPGTLYEVQPTFINVVPRILEKIASQVVIGMQRSSWVKRHVYTLGDAHRHALLARHWAGRAARACTLSRAVWARGSLVFRPLLRKIGPVKDPQRYSAPARLCPQDPGDCGRCWGVNVRNLYGITEGGYVLCQRAAFPSPTRWRAPIFPPRGALGRDGELLVRGPGLFRGYWRNDEGTRDTCMDGWLHTGDIAEANDANECRIVDRKKDIMITSGGKNIAPSEIENLLKSSPYISEAALIGDGRKFVTALDRNRLRHRLGVGATERGDLHELHVAGLARGGRRADRTRRSRASTTRWPASSRSRSSASFRRNSTRRRAIPRRRARSSASICTSLFGDSDRGHVRGRYRARTKQRSKPPDQEKVDAREASQ